MNESAKRSLVGRALRSLARDRDLPLVHRAGRAWRNGAALVLAPIALRDCDRVGARARTRGRPIVENLGTIEIGDDFQVNCAFTPVRLHAGSGGVLRIGDAVNINFGARISAASRVTLGSGVSLGPHVIIEDEDASGGGKPEPITIGDDVWLATRVQVRKGVSIGAGTIVTAGSVVETSLPPRVVAAGRPARVVRTLGTPEPSAQTPRAPQPKRAAEAKGLVIADFTATDVARALERDDDLGPTIEAETGPFDQVVQSLHRLASSAEQALDFAFVWTRPERVAPSFAKISTGDTAELTRILDEVDAFADLLVRAKGARFLFVASWTVPAYHRGAGMLDLRRGGLARTVAAMNARLAERLDEQPTTFILDAGRWMHTSAPHDTRLWYMGKVAFSQPVMASAALDVRAALRGVRGAARKLLVLDLDDTMWEGIVGDVGWQQLRLGGHDPVGEALVDFQRHVLALKKRGIALAVVSKNEEAVALEAIRSHPEMVIRQEDLAAWRINWQDKARNIVEIATELNLGLQSIVFIDDNPVERGRVREALPEVFVPEWPKDKRAYPEALLSLRCFDAPHASKEDAERTQMYAQERRREQARATVSSLDEWLDALAVVVRFAKLDASNLPRTTQLLNKTNQMNLRTRRLSEPELMAWANADGHEVWSIHVSDRFGDAGLTGILGIDVQDGAAEIADYVLSCRVMGRRVEEALVWFAANRAASSGAKELRAPYSPTPKNKPCLTFWESVPGIVRQGDVFTWPCEKPFPPPNGIQVVVEDAAPARTGT